MPAAMAPPLTPTGAGGGGLVVGPGWLEDEVEVDVAGVEEDVDEEVGVVLLPVEVVRVGVGSTDVVVIGGIIEVVIGGIIEVVIGGIIEVVFDVNGVGEGVGMRVIDMVDSDIIVVGSNAWVELLLFSPKAHELVKNVQVTKNTTEKSIFLLSKRALFEPKESL